jgi:hypothetical protein
LTYPPSVTSGVDAGGTVGVVTGSGTVVGVVTGRDTVDFGTGTELDRLVSVVVEPGDCVRVERDGREVMRMDALPGVVVEVAARLPRLGTVPAPTAPTESLPAAESPPSDGAKERVAGLASASDGPKKGR